MYTSRSHIHLPVDVSMFPYLPDLDYTDTYTDTDDSCILPPPPLQRDSYAPARVTVNPSHVGTSDAREGTALACDEILFMVTMRPSTAQHSSVMIVLTMDA